MSKVSQVAHNYSCSILPPLTIFCLIHFVASSKGGDEKGLISIGDIAAVTGERLDSIRFPDFAAENVDWALSAVTALTEKVMELKGSLGQELTFDMKTNIVDDMIKKIKTSIEAKSKTVSIQLESEITFKEILAKQLVKGKLEPTGEMRPLNDTERGETLTLQTENSKVIADLTKVKTVLDSMSGKSWDKVISPAIIKTAELRSIMTKLGEDFKNLSPELQGAYGDTINEIGTNSRKLEESFSRVKGTIKEIADKAEEISANSKREIDLNGQIADIDKQIMKIPAQEKIAELGSQKTILEDERTKNAQKKLELIADAAKANALLALSEKDLKTSTDSASESMDNAKDIIDNYSGSVKNLIAEVDRMSIGIMTGFVKNLEIASAVSKTASASVNELINAISFSYPNRKVRSC